MTRPAHALRSRLAAGGAPLLASFVMTPHRAVAQLLGESGFDVLIADAEHAPLGPAEVEEIVVGGDLAGVPTLVRVPGAGFGPIQHALDAGAAGVVVPRVETVEQAQAAVDAARYPPEGRRGAGPGRATLYGLEREAAIAHARAETVVVIQIETGAAVSNTAALAAVEGVDLVLVGPNDLSWSLGRPPEDELRATIDRVLDGCRAAGRATSILAPTAALAARYTAAGCALLATGTDLGCLVAGARAALAAAIVTDS